MPEYESSVSSIIDTNWEANAYFQKIIEIGGVERPQDSSQFVNVQCEQVNRPGLYFYSIKIFDRIMWIYLLIAEALITFAFAWYKMVL